MIYKKQKANYVEYNATKTDYVIKLKDNRIIYVEKRGSSYEYIINEKEDWNTVYSALDAFFNYEGEKDSFIEIYNQLNINSKEFELATNIIQEKIDEHQEKINNLQKIINNSKQLAKSDFRRITAIEKQEKNTCEVQVKKKTLINKPAMRPYEIDKNEFKQRSIVDIIKFE